MLTEGEKLLAIMLCDIMKKVGADSDIEPDFVADAIHGGQLWALKARYSGIFHGEDHSEDTAREVGKILSMCSFVEWSINQLPAAEQAEIPAEDKIVFVGFDGNNEEHFSVAKFMVEKMGDFAEFKGRDFNSHAPMVTQYNRQVDAWDHVRGGTGALSLEQIKTILAA